jgi:alpha-galactosidase/6-phospho-beta-glucosidase family protein
MAPHITIIGGGSYQWAPKLVIDLANMPSLEAAEIVLCDIDPAPLPRMVELVEHIAASRGIPMTVRATTNQREAMTGADYVVVNISTGGFSSMRHDIEIPARYGLRQPVGDSVGPGGITRALRNIPVLVGIARDMADVCPDAWLCNLTNPMTTLCRAVTRETDIKTVGLCHEVTGTRFFLSLLLDARFTDLDLDVVGVNHFPVITRLDVAGADGFAMLRDLLDDDERAQEPVFLDVPEGSDISEVIGGPEWTKAVLLEQHQLKFELFRRFGVLPAAGDRHLAEFMPGFITEQSGWGARWGVKLTSISDREQGQAAHVADFEALLASDEISRAPSGEMLAPLIDSMLRNVPRHLPLNMPNTGQCPDLPRDAVVESMCTVDGDGIRGGEPVVAPAGLTEQVRRVVAAQELTVAAAVSGDRELVLEAMLADPLAGRGDFGQLVEMTDELLDATRAWLPQFA